MDQYKQFLESISEFGTVQQIKGSIIIADGLPNARIHERVIFENNVVGEVFNLTPEYAYVIVHSFSSSESLRIGMKLVRTDEFLQIKKSLIQLGSIIDSFGNYIGGKTPDLSTPNSEAIDIHTQAPTILSRATISKPFYTGIMAIDLCIPLGKGQKELMLGDRKTGKSPCMISIVKHSQDITIYALIGKNKSDIKNTINQFEKANLQGNIVFVVSYADDPLGVIYYTPYTAMSIAEYFRDQGKDVTVVLDNMSTHAKFYRELSMLTGGFPGREAYPGDIFYVHSRLMERAGNFMMNNKEAAITCFPVVETVQGDVTSYISTNAMGMTDGHIYFDSNLYANGRRPPINILISITRVGKQTRNQLLREITDKIVGFLTSYDQLEAIAHFGTELSQSIKDQIRKGELLYNLFNHHRGTTYPLEVQLVLFGWLWLGLFDKYPQHSQDQIQDQLLKLYEKDKKHIIFTSTVQSQNLYQLLTLLSQKESELVALWQTNTPS